MLACVPPRDACLSGARPLSIPGRRASTETDALAFVEGVNLHPRRRGYAHASSTRPARVQLYQSRRTVFVSCCCSTGQRTPRAAAPQQSISPPAYACICRIPAESCTPHLPRPCPHSRTSLSSQCSRSAAPSVSPLAPRTRARAPCVARYRPLLSSSRLSSARHASRTLLGRGAPSLGLTRPGRCPRRRPCPHRTPGT